MADDDPDADFDDVARSFAALWHTLTTGSRGPHDPDRRHLLIDQVRDALDRGESRLADQQTAIIANTFTLETCIHESDTTQVYRARHRDLESLHAIKMLRPGQAGDPVAKRLLLREAGIGMSIRHPNVVATETLLRLPDGRPALVFEWLGQSLTDIPPENPFSVEELKTILISIVSGLDAIHMAGFVHGDLSPSNLLYGSDDFSDLKIADFGIALETGRHHAELDIAFAGRPEFAPPEQLAGQALDARADLYAAGKILSALLRRCRETGKTVDGLKAVAAKLSETQSRDRPENAKAALHLLDGLCK